MCPDEHNEAEQSLEFKSKPQDFRSTSNAVFVRLSVGYGLSEAFVTVGKIMARLRWPRVADFSFLL